MHNVNNCLVEGPVEVYIPESDIHHTDLRVSWKEATGSITGYKVHYIEQSSGQDFKSPTLSESTLSYVVRELTPGNTYYISVSGLFDDAESVPMPLGGLSIKTHLPKKTETKSSQEANFQVK